MFEPVNSPKNTTENLVKKSNNQRYNFIFNYKNYKPNEPKMLKELLLKYCKKYIFQVQNEYICGVISLNTKKRLSEIAKIDKFFQIFEWKICENIEKEIQYYSEKYSNTLQIYKFNIPNSSIEINIKESVKNISGNIELKIEEKIEEKQAEPKSNNQEELAELLKEFIKNSNETQQLMANKFQTALTTIIQSNPSGGSRAPTKPPFNLETYLNETCKNAMNAKDFIKTFKYTLDDFLEYGRAGIRVFLPLLFTRELQKIRRCDYPIQCSDVKRNILYIKDENKWVRNEGSEKLFCDIIRGLNCHFGSTIQVFSAKHPECMEDACSLAASQYQKTMGEWANPIPYSLIACEIAKKTRIDKQN